MADHSEPSINQFQSLTPDRVLSLVEKYLGRRFSNICRPLNSYINRVYELRQEDGPEVIAKFYRPGRWSRIALEDEHHFLLELAELEIPVIPPLELTTGSSLGEDGTMFFAVFPKKGGRTCDEFTEEQWLEIGRLLGRVHGVGAKRRPGDRLVLTPDRATRSQVDYILAHGFVPAKLQRPYEEVTAALLQAITPLFADRELIRIHGDCHFANLIYRPGESFYLIDFDDMAVGPPVQDLWMLLPGRPREALLEIDFLLEGYETFRPFDRRDLRLIEPLRAMRYIHFTAWCARQAADGSLARLTADWGTPSFWEQEISDLERQLQVIREEKTSTF